MDYVVMTELDQALLKSDYEFKSVITGGTFKIPTGFMWNGNSVPMLLEPLFGDKFDDKSMEPSCIHDFLYGVKGVPRIVADVEYLILLVKNKVRNPTWLFLGVRMFGWLHR